MDDGRSNERGMDGPAWRITPGLVKIAGAGVALFGGWVALTTLDTTDLGVSPRLNGALLTLIGSIGAGLIALAGTLAAAARAERRSDELEARREAQWQQREALAQRRLTEIETGLIERERVWQETVMGALHEIDTRHLAGAGVRSAEAENRLAALVDRQERERAEVVATIRTEMAGIRATLAALQQEREQREAALAAMRQEIDALRGEREQREAKALETGIAIGREQAAVPRINGGRNTR